MKMRRNFRLCCAGALAGAFVAGPVYAQSGTVTVRVGERTVALSRTDLAKLPRRTTQIGEGTDTATMSGVGVWDVLELAKAVPPAASGRQRAVMYLRLTGADGQDAVIALVEVDPSFSGRVAILADQRSGRPLDAVEGPWRVILPNDLRHARWLRGLVAIAVETVK
jgi:hypothetical protein